MKKKDVRVFNSEVQEVTKAVPVGVNLRLDQAVLKGDFSKFNKLAIILKPSQMLEIPPEGNVVCGYPMADELTCYPMTIRGTQFFGVAAGGLLYPGQSGGPVLSTITGVVFGLNTAVTENGILINPLVGILTQFGIKIQ
jgi:hypothetical protein